MYGKTGAANVDMRVPDLRVAWTPPLCVGREARPTWRAPGVSCFASPIPGR